MSWLFNHFLLGISTKNCHNFSCIYLASKLILYFNYLFFAFLFLLGGDFFFPLLALLGIFSFFKFLVGVYKLFWANKSKSRKGRWNFNLLKGKIIMPNKKKQGKTFNLREKRMCGIESVFFLEKCDLFFMLTNCSKKFSLYKLVLWWKVNLNWFDFI